MAAPTSLSFQNTPRIHSRARRRANAQIELIKTAKSIEDYSNSKLIRSVVKKVVIAEKTVEITYNAKNIKEALLILNSKGELSLIPHSKEIEPIVIAKQIKITQPSKSGNILILNAKENEAPEPNPYLINALVKCHYYHKQIQTGKTIEDLQNEENLKDTKYIRNILNLKYIPADLTEQILEGSQPEGLSLQSLMKQTN